ncbi:EpsG family protein [Lachnospiraceae bacterium 62-26]
MIYIIQCIWVYLSALLCFGLKLKFQRNKNLYLFLTFLPCFLMMGLRNVTVGVDTHTYSLYYSYIASSSWHDILTGTASYGLELGWRIVYKLCSYLSDSYYLFQIFFSIIYCWLYAKFLKKTVPNIFIAVILFLGVGLFTGAFNVQRQFLAAVILANGYLFFRDKKRMQAVLFFILAFLVHRTSFLFLAVLGVYQLRNSRWIIRLMPFAIFVIAYNYKYLIDIAKIYFPEYRNYYVNEKLIQTVSGVWIIWIIIIVLSAYTLYSRKIKSNDFKVYCIFGLAYVVCNIVGLYFNYFERIGLYFMPFLPAFFYGFGEQIHNKGYKLTYSMGLVLSFTAYYLLGCFTGTALTYSTFIFK